MNLICVGSVQQKLVSEVFYGVKDGLKAVRFVPLQEDSMDKGLCVNRRAIVVRLRELTSKGQNRGGHVEVRMTKSISTPVPRIFRLVRSQWRKRLIKIYRITAEAGEDQDMTAIPASQEVRSLRLVNILSSLL